MTESRIFKKKDCFNVITIYMPKREFCLRDDLATKVEAFVTVHDSVLRENVKIYTELCIVLRYGREDEETLGIPFVTEEVIQSIQLHPRPEGTAGVEEEEEEQLSPFHKMMRKRYSSLSFPVTFTINGEAPLSVHLRPSKEYHGAPVGITYYVRAFVEPTIRIRHLQRTYAQLSISIVKHHTAPCVSLTPRVAHEKKFLLFEGKVTAECILKKEIFSRDEDVEVEVTISNMTKKSIRALKVVAVQFTDVTMFPKGKFKNVVGIANTSKDCAIKPNSTFLKNFVMKLGILREKPWIAVEDFTKEDKKEKLCCTIESDCPFKEKIFPIKVSYYVKVTILLSCMGFKLNIKVPFKLLDYSTEDDFPADDSIFCARRPSSC